MSHSHTPRGGRRRSAPDVGSGSAKRFPRKQTRPGATTITSRMAGPSGPAVQRAATAGAGAQAPDQVRETAARGVSGSGGALPHYERIQAAFGTHDISGVRAHVGGAAGEASAAIGAEAYATGNRVAFRSQPDLHTAAHEAAHVVQQRAGVSLSGGVGQAGDSYERHADQVADAVVRGESAESLLGAGRGGAAAGQAVQRFGSREHKHLGDEGTRTDQGQARTVEIASGYFVSFGDLTAMAGDYFGSVDEIKRIAGNDGRGAGTREEIEYVRTVHVMGQKNAESSFSQTARDAVMARYYALAGNNSSHFTEPNGRPERTSLNNAGNYRDNHEQAIRQAAAAGAEGRSIDHALLCEGFASHYLTDAYAAGHVRTERISISDWWNPKVPMFWTNLKLFIAEQMAYYINDHATIGNVVSVQLLWEKIRASIESKGLPTLTFGDLVSGAVHDYDNHFGVGTQHGTLVGDERLRDGDGDPIREEDAQGNLARPAAAAHTENLAINAVRISAAEVERAYQMGASQSPDQIVTAMRVGNGGEYAAEALWPEALPDNQQLRARPPWQQGDASALLADPTMQEALTLFAKEKAESLNEALDFEDQTGVSADVQRAAFQRRVTGPLKARPLSLLQEVIDYTPNTGGGLAGSDSDDNAMEYVGMARDQGAMNTLTTSQRTKLIADLVAGVCGDDEEQTIIELLRTSSVSDMESIVTTLGRGRAADGIEFLDTGVDGAEWRTLKSVMRRSSTLRSHL
ncbi:eCIS core domain-containing protein [Haliangium ochraceum]|uniref:eCIS core domain-containing protein n=1 Tax=Haliangium ochraceum (strain DSM 14365 / JCM 11303 / SMP-2) TaxID=502025 RepID=D0LI08_HALO1|nr:DUF4157 domain-containing protein [Haliangium ochraceum]ACY14837.1 hypothetical protein Hoch_2294 [Haliangium ochraceum DSM 14365]